MIQLFFQVYKIWLETLGWWYMGRMETFFYLHCIRVGSRVFLFFSIKTVCISRGKKNQGIK